MKRKMGAWIILAIIVLIGGAAFVGYTVFKIEAISIEGNETYSDEEVLYQSGIEMGTNIFMLDENQVQQRISASPVIVYESLERRYPNEVVLRVRERIPVAVVQHLDAFLLIDEEGYIVEIGTFEEAQQYPVITGLNSTAFQLGAQIVATDDFQIQSLNRILVSLRAFDIRLSGIDISNTAEIVLISEEGISIRVGNADELEDKLNRAGDILAHLKTMGKTGGTLDVSSASGGNYIPD
ncbi:MAG: cell division protein FtsQ/DivIB [Christensenellales bacterium]